MRIAYALCVVVAGSAAAQVAGRIAGTVVDATTAPVPNAAIQLSRPGSSIAVLKTTTTQEGIFRVTGVQPDLYDLVVEAQGFRRQTMRGVKIDAGLETSLAAIRLEVGAVSEVVDVSASPQAVQITNAEVGTTLRTDQVRSLPMLNRSPLVLIQTQAGVVSGRGNTSINGQRVSFANVTLDGINIQDNFIRTNVLDFLPNLLLLDQVAEFTVLTSNANAANGNGSSQIIFTTPSGTNQYHGALLWSNRNYKTSANTWFNNQRGIARAPLNQNQAGGSISGPIIRNKLFFFANYEAFRLRQQSTVNRTILTSDARRGIFTYADAGGNIQKVNVLERAGLTMDPTIQQMLQQVPGPERINNFTLGDSRENLSRNSGGYAFPMRNNRTRDNVTGKLDYNLSTSQVFTTTFAWNRDILDRIDGVNSNDFSTIPKVHNDDDAKFLSSAWRWTPRPNLTNELRGGMNIAPGFFNSDEKYPPYLLAGLIFSNPVNTTRQEGRFTDTYNLADNANYIRGRHSIQFGFQMQKINVAPYDEFGTVPTYTLGIGTGNTGLSASQVPGASAADLASANNMLANLAGMVTSFTQTFNVTSRTSGFVDGARNSRQTGLTTYAGYVQDTWKTMPRLTLNLGVRYEYYTRVEERAGRALMPVVSSGSIINTLLSNATLDFAGSAVGRPWYGKDLNNFAPNAGLAWDVFGNGKTAFRAGYSVNFVNDETIEALMNNVVTTNKGLTGISSATGVTGTLRNLPRIPVPAFKVPRTAADNFLLDTTAALGIPDPNLRTPYVQQWSFGIQHEIKHTIVEIRYTGNHATKQFRGFDFNQVVIKENGFLDDFIRAQNNGNLARARTGRFDPTYNASVPGSQPLPVFGRLTSGGLLTNATVSSLIETGQAGELASTYHRSGFTGVQFYRNPNSLGTNLLTNYSNSSFNSLQVDVRRQVGRPLLFQANYVFSKVLSDSAGENQFRFEAFLDKDNAQIERSRTIFDLTHVIKANAVYDVPLGRGHAVDWRPLTRVLSGWQTSGIMTWQSGTPYSILSARDTLNRNGRSTQNTASTALDKSQLDELLGFRMTPAGPYFIAPGAISSRDGRAVAPDGSAPFDGQVFFNPGPGAIGALQRRMFSGPWDFELDLGMVKETRLFEHHVLQLRMDAVNIFNHPTFWVGADTNTNINGTQFGRIAANAFTRRLFQFGLRYQF